MKTLFSQRLKQLREEKGLKQAQIAEILNYGSTAISNYESGRNEPSYNDLIKIANFFDVSIDYLLGYSDVKKYNYQYKLSDFYKCFEDISLSDALKIVASQKGI